MELFVILAAIILAHFLLNFIRLVSTVFYYRKFKKYDKSLEQYTYPVSRLFDKAATNRILASTEYAGEKISYCIAKSDYREYVDAIFQQTIGVFRFRMRNSFNPLYWFELPIRSCKSLGINLPSPVNTLIKIVFWLIGIVAGYYVEKFLSSGYLSNLLSVLCNSLK